MQLLDSVVLVTGAAKRVGRAIATAFAKKGASLAIHYNRSRGPAVELAKELHGKFGARCEVFGGDFMKVHDIESVGKRVLRTFGRVDVLVNSASTYESIPFGKVSEKDWHRLVDVNLKAPFFLSQAVGPAMKKAGRGKIVNISDWAAIRPYAGYAAYCAAKAGLLSLTFSLAKALAPQVQVNAVLPGPVLPPPGLSKKELEAIRNATLVKKLGSPNDVASAVVFLCEGSDFITGATLTVDGGRLIA